jgi:replicative DNA helicase
VIFQLSNDQIGVLLKHLWATDGCIHAREGGSSKIYYSTNSVQLAGDVAALLLRLGIVARTRTTQKGSYKPNFHVAIESMEAQQFFLDRVGAFGPRVPQAESLLARLSTMTANPNVDTLPEEVFGLVKQKMTSLGISHRIMARLRGTAYGGSSHFAFAPSRSTVLSYAAILEDETLTELAMSDLFWDTIVAIEPAGEEEVYDLTVPGTASWLADGIVSHNSGAIEQDADVVMFVHRPETYKIATIQDDEMGQIPSEGIAEIIIGKQRNGPTGIVRVAFKKEYAGFEKLAPMGFEAYLPPPPQALESENPF